MLSKQIFSASFIALLMCSAPALLAQQTADEVLARAREIYSREGAAAALPEFEKALAQYRKDANRRGEAITLGYIGNSQKRLGNLTLALDYLRRALAMKRELGERLEEGKTLSHLGLVYWERGEYAEAIRHLTESISIARELKDRQLEAAALNNLSLVYDEQGDYPRSLEQYRRALELHRTTNFAEGESATLGNIGGVHLLLGRFREAMRYYQQALEISERLNLKPSASLDLGNLALCHLGLGHVEEALSTFDKALLLARETGSRKSEADWHKGKGSAFLRLGKYDSALEEYRKALPIYENAGFKRELVELLNDRGNLYVLLGDAGSAEKDFRRGMELAQSIGYSRGVMFNLSALGDLELRLQRYEQAAALYRTALERSREAGDNTYTALLSGQLARAFRLQKRFEDAAVSAQQALAAARATESGPLEARAFYALGEVDRARGRIEEALRSYAAAEKILRKVPDPDIAWQVAYGQGQALEALGRDEQAVGAYQRAISVIESVRGQLSEERFRSGYIEDKYQVYVALVQLLLKLKRAGEAFQASERLRARSYLDLLLGGPHPTGGDAAAELHERIRQLQRALDQENTKPGPQRRSQAVELFSAELSAAERAYQELLDDLRRQQPEHAMARALGLPSTDELQGGMPAHSVLVEYVIADHSLSILVLTSSEVRGLTVPVPSAELQTKVELLRELIVRTENNDWWLPAASLYQLLIQPIERAGWLRGSSQLLLVPHGILHYLPFGALPQSSSPKAGLLVERYNLAYLPSAAALVYGSPRRSGQSLFAIAPGRARLQHVAEEARTISKYFPPKPFLLVGAEATEGSFKRLAGNFQVVHLATHGFLNKLNPLFSGLELEPDQREDGRLEVYEILGLRLKAHLVTLSACDTALGGGYFTEVPAGDDFVGLTRAFLFAGSPSVLASLWEVNDRSTLRLMSGFYRRLQQFGKAEALAQVQRDMLRNGGRYSHPYFWAAFVLVGEMN